MAFIEVTPQRLQQKDSDSQFRLLMDSVSRIHIHLWLDIWDKPIRFQISDNKNVLEWKKDRGIKTGRVDEGSERQMNIKSSPLMILSHEKNNETIEYFLDKLKHSSGNGDSKPTHKEKQSSIQLILTKIIDILSAH